MAAPFNRRRATILMLVFLVWGGVIAGRLSLLMIFGRGRYVAEMELQSWRHGMLPARRGRLLDKDGTPLAWSTREFAVMCRIPEDPEDDRALFDRIQARSGKLFARLSVDRLLLYRGREVELLRSPTSEQIESLGPLLKSIPQLRLSSFLVRHGRPMDPVSRQRLGQVRTDENGVEVGVSGQEKAHEKLLQGEAGTYRVMIDKRGEWIPGTWKKVREMQPGYDVYLSCRVTD